MARKLFNINSRILNQFYIYVYFCWLWKWDIFILKVCIFSRVSQLYKLLVAGRWFPCLFWFPLPKIENMMYLKYCWKPCTERTPTTQYFFSWHFCFLLFRNPRYSLKRIQNLIPFLNLLSIIRSGNFSIKM
jgi:hypothetical protein